MANQSADLTNVHTGASAPFHQALGLEDRDRVPDRDRGPLGGRRGQCRGYHGAVANGRNPNPPRTASPDTLTDARGPMWSTGTTRWLPPGTPIPYVKSTRPSRRRPSTAAGPRDITVRSGAARRRGSGQARGSLAEALPTMPFTDHAVRRRGRPDLPYARATQPRSRPDTTSPSPA